MTDDRSDIIGFRDGSPIRRHPESTSTWSLPSPVPHPGGLETISAKYQMTMVIHLNDDEFDHVVKGESFRVFEVNVSIRETGEVSAALKFRGKKRQAWTVRFDALPERVQDEIQRVYSEHRAAMPEKVFPTLSRA
jgi:hypothetical protein